MRQWLSVLMVLVVAGCAAPAPEKAPEPDHPATGVRLLEMQGGYIDQLGVGAEPAVSRLVPWVNVANDSNMAGVMGITLTRVVSDSEIFATRTLRWLAVGPHDELTVTVNGQRVVLHALEEGKRWHRNNQSGGYSFTTYYEQVRYGASAADMARLTSGAITRVEARGTKGATLWPRSGKQMLPEFSTQVAAFYREQIAPRM